MTVVAKFINYIKWSWLWFACTFSHCYVKEPTNMLKGIIQHSLILFREFNEFVTFAKAK